MNMIYPSPRLTKTVASGFVGSLIAAILSTPASAAWTTDCLWNGIGAADRTAAISAMSEDARPAFRLAPAKIKAALEACGVTKAESRDAQNAFAAYGAGLAAMAALERRYGISQAQILGAWSALPNGDRTSFVGIARNMRNEPQKMAVLQGIASQMSQRLNLSNEATPHLRQVAYSLALLQSIGRGGIGQ